jgi:hypothetical protein
MSQDREGIIWFGFGRATHVIWLNYSFPRIMLQLLRRTLRRSLSRKALFSGNRESLAQSFLSRDSILLFALRTYHRRRRDYRHIIRSNAYPHIQFIELASPAETEEWVEELVG